MSARPKENGPRGQAKFNNQSNQQPPNYESILAALQAGRSIRLIDFDPDKRASVIGVIAQLRDLFPVRAGWQTVRQSHLSETRLRARRYWLPGEFIAGADNEAL